MSLIIVESRDIGKSFAVHRPIYQQVFDPFAPTQRIHALEGINFAIKQGEILGVVGPNGAGKTTLLRILAGLLEPDKGLVRLCGQKLNGAPHLRGKIGYVPSDERSFFWRLTGKQNLEFFGRLYGMPRPESQGRINELLKLFALEHKASHLFRDYSTGTRKKFALIRALVHRPKIVLLDELTNSLDVSSTQSVKSFVREYVASQSGCAGVWSTHRLEEIVEVCDKLLVIDKGRVSFFGSISDLKNCSDGKTGDSKDGPPGDSSTSSCKYRLLLKAVELSITET
jgi:ABC-2 type transport system ATP-binding protein